jgi:hypothetical protein
VAEGWRKLHNEKLHNFYASPNVRVIESRRMTWTGHVTRMGDEKCIKRLVGKPEGKRPVGRPRRRCKYNHGMDLREVH